MCDTRDNKTGANEYTRNRRQSEEEEEEEEEKEGGGKEIKKQINDRERDQFNSLKSKMITKFEKGRRGGKVVGGVMLKRSTNDLNKNGWMVF